MQNPHLEFKIEESRFGKNFLKSIEKDYLNGREFKDGYHTLNNRNTNDFD